MYFTDHELYYALHIFNYKKYPPPHIYYAPTTPAQKVFTNNFISKTPLPNPINSFLLYYIINHNNNIKI